MELYKKLYLDLFNTVSDVIRQLQQVQIDTEEHYINEALEEADGEQ